MAEVSLTISGLPQIMICEVSGRISSDIMYKIQKTGSPVILSRSAPTALAVGLVSLRGAFYYHAWAEVWLAEGRGRGLWLPVDPTFNEFPADATHLRLARGGLDQQTAIVPLIGHLKMTILDLDLVPGSTPIVVGRSDTGPGR